MATEINWQLHHCKSKIRTKRIAIVLKACFEDRKEPKKQVRFQIEELNTKRLSRLLLCDKRVGERQTSEEESGSSVQRYNPSSSYHQVILRNQSF